jgi:hypothetical protein
MDEPIQSSMLDGTDFTARLDAASARVAAQARAEAPAGLTEPDPGADERWEAAQVWAHMAEFVGYWHEQIEGVVGEYAGDPVPFGRLKTDPGRLAAIEVGRHEPISLLAGRVQDAVDELRRYLGRLTVAEWAARGRHQTAGDLDVEQMVSRFVVDHLEEHLDQLDRLAAEG